MTENKIIKKLAEKYVEIWGRHKKANPCDELGELKEKRYDAQLDLLDDIFRDFFSIENLYINEGQLMSEGERIS